MLTPAILPQEILDTVIDELNDKLEALRNCALVSHRFRPRSQKHLFSTVHIKFPGRYKNNGRHPLQELLKILTLSLARNINHVRISNYAENVWDDEKKCYTRNCDEILPLLFNQLHRLQSFMLSLNKNINDNACDELSASLATALVTMLYSTQVPELNMHLIKNFPVALLAFHCPHLKRLDPTLSSWQTGVGMVPELLDLPTSDQRGHLEKVIIETSGATYLQRLYDMTKLPRSRLTFSRLREIEVNGCTGGVIDLVSSFIYDSAESLEKFTYDCGDSCFDSRVMNFTLPNHLRSLRLAFDYSWNSRPTHLDWLCKAVERIAGNSSLEEVMLVFTTNLVESFDHIRLWNGYDDWAGVFDRLLTSGGHPRLRRVSIFLNFTPFFYEVGSDSQMIHAIPISSCGAVVRELKGRLPLLAGKGKLSVQWLVTSNLENGLRVASRVVEEGLRGGVHVGFDGKLHAECSSIGGTVCMK
ncbi:hypothetical protein Hypma_005143 [Hypsizygus marmoreus]|uniref:F-box domain-containing protein n=1 Tax=Hypsizygus marmoreus TaxID=39966 RepID=A0A369K5H5_HYPMA|nr:hypothetical protein Hypma_005143 [Hypsizygus marmoreus]